MWGRHVGKSQRGRTYLESQNLGLDELERTSVDLDETAASLEISHHVSLLAQSSYVVWIWVSRTLQWATAVAVFFLPKHWTELLVDMIAVVVMPEDRAVDRVVLVLILRISNSAR